MSADITTEEEAISVLRALVQRGAAVLTQSGRSILFPDGLDAVAGMALSFLGCQEIGAELFSIGPSVQKGLEGENRGIPVMNIPEEELDGGC